MPFKSKKQEDYLRINEPEVYKRWKKRYDNGGINVNVAPGVSINMGPKGIGATVEGETTIQGNIPLSKEQDASVLIKQEIDVGEDGLVSVNLWKTEGRGGGVGIEGRIPFNKGGMGGCPMDGAVIKGGTTIKPDRYTHGKRKVKNGKTSTT